MAKAEPIFHPRPVPSPDGVILTLTKEEALCLRAICTRIGGSPYKSRRKHMDDIEAALIAAGFRAVDTGDMMGDAESNRAIYFKDNQT